MTKVIFLNGPPRSGKDTAAEYLYFEYDNVTTGKFAELLHINAEALLDTLGVSIEYATEKKDEPIPGFPVSYRQYMIDMSEGFMKPKYGKDIFGRITAADISQYVGNAAPQEDVFVISDSGFDYEAYPIIDLVGPENCVLVKLSRQGCNFKLDSRSYVSLVDKGVTEINIVNDDLTEFLDQIDVVYQNLVKPPK